MRLTFLLILVSIYFAIAGAYPTPSPTTQSPQSLHSSQANPHDGESSIANGHQVQNDEVRNRLHRMTIDQLVKLAEQFPIVYGFDTPDYKSFPGGINQIRRKFGNNYFILPM